MTITPFEVIEIIQKPGEPELLKLEDLNILYKFISPAFDSIVNKNIKYLESLCEDNNTNCNLFYNAYKEKINEHLKNALNIYLFKTKKWKDNIPLILYLKKSLKHFVLYERENLQQITRKNFCICPVCKNYGEKIKLICIDKNVFFCYSCKDYVNNFDYSYDDKRYKLSLLFAYHSKKGIRCDNCNKFVPYSLMRKNKLSCPFCEQECANVKEVAHPSSSFNISLVNQDDGFYNKNVDYFNNVLEKEQEINNMINVLVDIISVQKNINGKTRNSPNKQLLYEAIYNLLLKDPINVINFLINKNKADFPMLSVIFQEFSKNMIELLPLEFDCNGKIVVVNSPIDYDLKLFTGIYNFQGFVNQNFVLKKPTKSLIHKVDKKTYEGLYSFIGLIKSVTDDDGNDLSNFVDYYGFTNIKFKKEDFLFNKNIIVEYYAIPSHYSMLSMSHMRRILKKIYVSYLRKTNKQ